MKNNIYVKAGEIGDFVYCKRGWWLNFNNLLPASPAMQEGTKQHNLLALFLTQLKMKKIAAWSLIILGVIAAGITLGILFSQ